MSIACSHDAVKPTSKTHYLEKSAPAQLNCYWRAANFLTLDTYLAPLLCDFSNSVNSLCSLFSFGGIMTWQYGW
jgi:hypothetical protein